VERTDSAERASSGTRIRFCARLRGSSSGFRSKLSRRVLPKSADPHVGPFKSWNPVPSCIDWVAVCVRALGNPPGVDGVKRTHVAAIALLVVVLEVRLK